MTDQKPIAHYSQLSDDLHDNRIYIANYDVIATLFPSIAEKVALLADMISKIERGIASPSFLTIEKLSEVLEVPEDRQRDDAHPLKDSNQAVPPERRSIG